MEREERKRTKVAERAAATRGEGRLGGGEEGGRGSNSGGESGEGGCGHSAANVADGVAQLDGGPSPSSDAALGIPSLRMNTPACTAPPSPPLAPTREWLTSVEGGLVREGQTT